MRQMDIHYNMYVNAMGKNRKKTTNISSFDVERMCIHCKLILSNDETLKCNRKQQRNNEK